MWLEKWIMTLKSEMKTYGAWKQINSIRKSFLTTCPSPPPHPQQGCYCFIDDVLKKQ